MAMLMHKILLASGLLVLGCNAILSEGGTYSNQSFAGYMTAFGKNYVKGSTEYAMREGLFHSRLAEILAHNSAEHSWTMGLNEFTDWTEGELLSLRGYKRRHTGYNMPDVGSIVETRGVRLHGDVEPADKPHQENQPSGSGLTGAMDWTPKLATAKDVINQGPCGSCWAVAATATIQLHAAMTHPGFSKILSPENVNKCAPNPMQCGGDGGCQGSTPELAFTYLQSLGSKGGLYTMDQLAYTAETGTKIPHDSCSKTGLNNLRQGSSTKPAVTIGGWVQVPTNHENQVMHNLVNKGPLTVAVVGAGIQGYSKGIISGCKSTVVDHAVVMMGYGKDPVHNMPYWNIRNSWGNGWGEEGFFRLKRHTMPPSLESGASLLQGGSKEPCAWDNDPAKGVACKNEHGKYPEKTWVCGVCGIVSDVAYPTGVKVNPAMLI